MCFKWHSVFIVERTMKNIIVSLSGGMDSSTLLLRAISEVGADHVTALSYDYGQKHLVELERAQMLVDYLSDAGHTVTYQVIRLDGLAHLLESALVDGGSDVPEGHYTAETMKETVVPNRNKIFASITQAAALSVVKRTHEKTAIALGIHAGDHEIYPDCRQEFRDADDAAFRAGNWDADQVVYFTPYLEGDKFDILKDGEKLCEELNLDFDEVYTRTNTSYKPMQHQGVWYSDYKSSSSVERVEAFIKLGRADPVAYADHSGPVSWAVAKQHVEGVIKAYQQS
jgi:7-cyano-7-deazaguanine synthase